MITTILAYLLIALFFGVIDRQLRVGQEAKRLDQTQSDRGSTRLIGYAFFVTGLALAAALILNYLSRLVPVRRADWLERHFGHAIGNCSPMVGV